MFEIRELSHLISIDEFRHFGRAAKAVGLSQPALTKSLQRMERAVGAKLFERSRAGVIPTVVGVEVLARARRLVDDVAELQRAIDLINDPETGLVTVGIGPAMSETYVAEAIAALVQRRPRVQVAVRVDHWRQLSKWLAAGELDFYVADVGDAAIDKRFHYTSLPPVNFVWFCRKAHPLANRNKQEVTREDLLRFPIASPKMPRWATEWFQAASVDEGTVPRQLPAIECESYTMLKRLVYSSDCVSAALQQTLVSELDDNSFVVLSVDAPPLTTHAGIVRLSDRTPTALAEELIADIEDLAERRDINHGQVTISSANECAQGRGD